MNSGTDHAEEITRDLLSRLTPDPSYLLQYLIHLQQRLSCIPSASVAVLVSHLGLTRAHIESVIDFYGFLHHAPRGDYDILFSDNITDRMGGSQLLMRQLCDHFDIAPGQRSAGETGSY